MVPVAVRQPARGAPLGGNHEHVGPAGVDVSLPVAPVAGPFHHLGLAHPLGALRSARKLHAREVGPVGHPAGEGDPLAVGGPPRPRWPVLQARDLADRALVVHPADEELGAAGLAARAEEDARAVRRPAGPAAVDEMPGAGAVGVHDPKRRFAAVRLLVDPAARVHDALPVGRDARIGHALHVQVVGEREPLLGGRGGGDREDREGHQGDGQPGYGA